MNTKVREKKKSLCTVLIILIMAAILVAVVYLTNRNSKEKGVSIDPTEKVTAATEVVEDTDETVGDDEDWMKTYHQVCEYIDQGDAKLAADALLGDPESDAVYTMLYLEDRDLLESILVDAACLYNEEGDLYDFVLLRQKGFFSDELFLKYWERTRTEIPEAMDKDRAYDGYLFHEIRSWYERGEHIIAQIIDLRYLGMIPDDVYGALVAEWEMDLMDGVDTEEYIPQYGMQLSEMEMEQIRTWQGCVNKGEIRKAAQMMLGGDITDNVYRWMRKNDADLTDTILAQAMYELEAEGAYEQLAQLILDGYASDNCFDRYWSLLEFTPEGKERYGSAYQNADLYFVYEMERICGRTKDPSLVQTLWEDNLIDEYLYDLLASRIGSWEA